MIQRSSKRLSLRAVFVDDELGHATAEGRAARTLIEELRARDIEVIEATSAEDGASVIVSDSAIHAVLMDWTMSGDKDHASTRRLLDLVRSRNDKIPIFLMAERDRGLDHPHRGDAGCRRVHLDPGGHRGVRRGTRRRGHAAVSRGDDAAARGRDDEAHPGVPVLVAHTGPPRRHRVPQVTGRPDLLRLLRRESASLRLVGQRRQPRIAARPHGTHGRARAVCGAGVRRASHVLRHRRHVHVEPGHLHGGRRPGSDRPVRPELPQVDRTQPRHDGSHPELPRAAAKPLRDHRTHPARPAQEGDHQGCNQGEPSRAQKRRLQGGLRRRDQLHLRWALLQRAACRGAPRSERRPDSLR